MFDDLRDPDPPAADMATLTRVAKRAEQLRRRRALIVGTAAGALVVAATIATVAIARSDDAEGRLVVGVSPSSAPSDSTPVVSSTVTSIVGQTTSTTRATGAAPTSVAVAPTTAATVAPETSVVVETTVAPETTTTAAPTTTTTVPVPVGPIVAIDANGDAVLVALDGANTVLFDGTDPDDPPPAEGETSGIDAVAVTADRSRAFIGVCCEPVAGTLLQTTPPAPADVESPSVFGHGPALSPGGSTLARIVYDTLVVSDLSLTQLASIPENFDLGFTYDLMWADEQHLLALRSGPAGTDLRVLTFSGATLTESAIAVVPAPGATFAGRAAGLLYVNGVAPGVLGAYDSATLTAVPDRNIALPGALSAWVEDGLVRWVDTARVLHVGDLVVPGQYLWVR